MLESTQNPDGTITLSIGDASISLTAAELDEQIAQLAQLRARVPDKVPLEAPPVGAITVNPGYGVRVDSLSKACLLRIRHGGLGWLNFELPPQEVLHMKRMWNDIVQKLGLDPPDDLYTGPERRRRAH